MDDVPLRLCATRAEAKEFARVLVPQDIIGEAADVNGVRVGQLISVGLVEFRDGAPMRMKILRDFDDEGEE
jgi:hypothetical protein